MLTCPNCNKPFPLDSNRKFCTKYCACQYSGQHYGWGRGKTDSMPTEQPNPESDCNHVFAVAPVTGPTSFSICMNCGEQRTVNNHLVIDKSVPGVIVPRGTYDDLTQRLFNASNIITRGGF